MNRTTKQLTALLIAAIALFAFSGCATKGGIAVYGWKSNVTVSNEGDATAEAFIEATTDAKADASLTGL